MPLKKTFGASSFATFMIVVPVAFFLGVLFASFPYDYPLLWTSAPITDEFVDQLTTHLTFLHQSPPLIGRLLNIIMLIGMCGFFIKLFNPTEANVLFDGASLVLYLIGAGVYLANIVKGLRSVSKDIWSQPGWDEPRLGPDGQPAPGGPMILGKMDSLKVMAASNTILALVLVGVLVLQAGQWYAESKEKEEKEQIEKDYQAQLKEREEKKEDKAASAAGKKKQ